MADIELQDDHVVEEFFQSFQRECYRLTRLGHPGLPASAALLVGLLPPRRRATLPQSHFRGLHTRSGDRLLRCSLGAANLSPPRHQYSDELGPAILGNRWVGSTPPATIDDEVASIVGSRRSAHQKMVFGLLQAWRP
jgi:hypothetical protein